MNKKGKIDLFETIVGLIFICVLFGIGADDLMSFFGVASDGAVPVASTSSFCAVEDTTVTIRSELGEPMDEVSISIDGDVRFRDITLPYTFTTWPEGDIFVSNEVGYMEFHVGCHGTMDVIFRPGHSPTVEDDLVEYFEDQSNTNPSSGITEFSDGDFGDQADNPLSRLLMKICGILFMVLIVGGCGFFFYKKIEENKK